MISSIFELEEYTQRIANVCTLIANQDSDSESIAQLARRRGLDHERLGSYRKIIRVSPIRFNPETSR